MSSGEIVDILNAKGAVIGTVTRGEAENDNHITGNVIVFLFNSVGRVWKQLRPEHKEFGGLWDASACGSTLSRESPLDAAQRETKQETGGLKIDLQEVDAFLNVFPRADGEPTSRYSFVFIGLTDEIPQPNEEVDKFEADFPIGMRMDAVSNPHLYVPSFVVELDRAVYARNKLI